MSASANVVGKAVMGFCVGAASSVVVGGCALRLADGPKNRRFQKAMLDHLSAIESMLEAAIAAAEKKPPV